MLQGSFHENSIFFYVLKQISLVAQRNVTAAILLFNNHSGVLYAIDTHRVPCHTSLSCTCIQLYTHDKVINIVKSLTVLSPQDRIVTCLDIHAIGVLHTHVLLQLMDTATIPTLLSTAPPQVKTI